MGFSVQSARFSVVSAPHSPHDPPRPRRQVLGLEQYGISPEAFARAAQKKFSCACTTTKVEGKKNHNKAEVVIQGERTREVTAYLQSEFGLPGNAVATAKKGGSEAK